MLAALLPGSAPAQTTVDTIAAIRARGQLVCGVGDAAGFARPDSRGEMRGLDVDACRAVAAAILGDANKVRFVPTTTQMRFTALQSGEVDMLARSTTWTLGREAQLGLAFASINFYDGQGFMVKQSSGITSARQLDGATICVSPGTTSELNLADFFRTNNMRFTPVVIQQPEEIRAAFIAGRCDALTNDASVLASLRASQGATGEQFILLPEIISKEPLGAAVRKGDWRFFDVVRWSHFAMVSAEELGITGANIDSHMGSQNPDVQRLLGRSADFGRAMGLDNEWAVRIIRQVGNFGESWERNITPLGVPRGINNLWTRGGLQYAPPIR
ncbi:amino acid ABC transporter substrate-binding protein [Falsiroseomonas sp. HW251]|uniref:amino acid ABC transporter substrate-binding protein n=1 Tax=Falsiroseomonas sp. HW251 TaxID=3390998 RepID=UPI003D3210FD